MSKIFYLRDKSLLVDSEDCTKTKISHCSLETEKKIKENFRNYFRVEKLNKSYIFKILKISNFDTNSRNNYQCNLENCKKIYKLKWHLERHLLSHLNLFTNFICPYENCGNGYKMKENLIFHYKNVHLNIKPFRCNFCSAIFSHRQGKLYHERKNHPQKLVFKCYYENCFISFASSKSRDHHSKIIHKERQNAK